MLEKHCHCLTRYKSKNILIHHELDSINNKVTKDYYGQFQKAFNNTQDCLRYSNGQECNEQSNRKTLMHNDVIAYCLNDNSERGYGMQLVMRYNYLIQLQNELLLSFKNKHDYSNEAIGKKMLIQYATPYEIVSIDIENNSTYDSFEELIASFYTKERGFDINMIENMLGKILLPGKRQFDRKQFYINYAYEGCIGDHISIATNFAMKYPIEEAITFNQENLLFKYINDNKFQIDKVVFSIPILMHYVITHDYSNEELIDNIIGTLPMYINIECKSLFEGKNSQLKVNQLIKVLDYFERLCFNSIIANIIIEQCAISKECINKIQLFVKDAKDYYTSINPTIMITVLRRFISRRLCGGLNNIDIKQDSLLFDCLIEKEYWPNKTKESDIKEELNRLSQSFNFVMLCSIRLIFIINLKETIVY